MEWQSLLFFLHNLKQLCPLFVSKANTLMTGMYASPDIIRKEETLQKSYSLHKSCSNPAFIHLSIINPENLKLSSNLNSTGKCFRSFFLSSKTKLP